ncbi:MAG TPA: hypothetical protein VLM43_03530, partial [Desulfobacterales bacterium]|nr:hypothetical protein [Desulfobacterales bacterium]
MGLIQYAYLFVYLFALISLFIYGINCYILMVFYLINYPKTIKKHEEVKVNFYKKVSSKNWPHTTIQLPIYNELYVAERLIESVCRIDYPRNLLQIQVLDD